MVARSWDGPLIAGLARADRDWKQLVHDGTDYEWCIASGWINIKLRRVGAGKKMMKQWKHCRSGNHGVATRKRRHAAW